MMRARDLVLAAVVAVAVLTVRSPQSQAQQLGDFSVGHATRLLNVPGTLGENRPLNVHLWYPARNPNDCGNSGNSGGNGDDRSCSAPSVYTSRLNGIPLLPQWDPLSWTIGSSVSFENLPIARGHRPFPVIVFSHGNQGGAVVSVYTLEALVSFGFIVAAPDHLNNTQDDVRIDFINSLANAQVIPCFDGLAWSAQSPCTHISVPETMIDRAHDISAVIDALPTWLGDRVDISRVGVMGASRGSIAAFVAAGGSTTWGIPADPRVKAIMGVTFAAPSITFGANLHDVTVPALLVDGTLDMASPPVLVQAAFDMLGSTEKELVLIENATHRHFASGLCAITQSAGAIATANPRAILDLHAIRGIITFPPLGVAMDFCGFETFTTPSDIRPLVFQLTGFNVTPTNVPRTGLDSTQVNEKVTELAAAFFRRVLGVR